MTAEDSGPGAKLLNDAFCQLPSLQPALRGSSPWWYDKLLSALLLVTDGAEPLYVDGSFSRDDDLDYFAVEVVLFTGDFVVHSKLSGKIQADADSDVFVSVIPRKSLTTFSVSTQHSVFPNDAFASWPGQLIVKAVYPSLELSMPLSPGASDLRDATLRQLVSSLGRDLVGVR
jgi:hypothetical protein